MSTDGIQHRLLTRVIGLLGIASLGLAATLLLDAPFTMIIFVGLIAGIILFNSTREPPQ
ncbi:hypothetical protein [Novosphingobium malaysiense]|uniref:hypothetical protein n=1 Tax=Novosphingobium malaysiense TaxID=1348853 RepID=UPI0012E05FC9|nr:hypothetical protein [Novosphingobium malaysiense]